MLKDYDLKPLVQPLKEWFLAHARKLPWRDRPEPYYVWISEIMLQQTRVEAVKPYFQRFIDTLPDVTALAECPEDTYLKLWEGLGYYNRVRNLHQAAVQILEEYGGVIPADYETLLHLKGIGHYTAGAIASLAYNKPVPAVDGNVLRVLTRVSGDDTDIMKQSFRNETERILKELLEAVCPEQVSPRIFNQALMELGALVCVPNGSPHCGECPWKESCIARTEGKCEQLPVRKKSAGRRIENRTVLLLQERDRIAIHKRPARGLLAGLYEYPNLPGHLTEQDVFTWAKELGYRPLHMQRLADSRHIFSHVEWQMTGYHLVVEKEEFPAQEQRKKAKKEHLLFIGAKEQEMYAVPSAFAAYKKAAVSVNAAFSEWK